ncbi:MAG: four helix bundle protein, partial [Myxococcales bacterium]|nr:four helix bundle protein [Deltaproteobacteria bacterium]NNL25762.1 four helix bundle protein [Myxococcales bacterium]
MGLIIQQRALQAAGGLREVLPVVRKRDRSLFDQIHRAMNSVVLNIAEADGNDAGTARARFASACGSAKEVRAGLQLAIAYGYVPGTKVAAVDIALAEAPLRLARRHECPCIEGLGKRRDMGRSRRRKCQSAKQQPPQIGARVEARLAWSKLPS